MANTASVLRFGLSNNSVAMCSHKSTQ